MQNKKLHRPWRGLFTVAEVPNESNIKFVKNHSDKLMSAYVYTVKHFHALTPPAVIRRLTTEGIMENKVNRVADSANSHKKVPTQLELELHWRQWFIPRKRAPVILDPPLQNPATTPQERTTAAAQHQENDAVSENSSSRHSVASDIDNGEQHFGTPPGSPVTLPTLSTHPLPPPPQPTLLQRVAQDVFQARRTRHSDLPVTKVP